ncbi:MAG: hypothetical protein JOZ39_01605 [Chloroflexi bacterium]|nr:hypothetical protein [Chloroflexota bacterium]
MDLDRLQTFTHETFGRQLESMSVDYGVARLLTQTGDLGDAVLHQGDVAKEITAVMIVVAALANRTGVKMAEALDQHLYNRDPKEILAAIDKKK